ncbi:hypothetical protein GCM10007276_01950 [Agaricicola taiwanensis]|uniref:Branched-chain amino acid ABC transporter permease n=1 Tax=Agaricicola taiwanensis TaxID=591372 RepID=A0A8J2VJB1_9RHOB|nr:branched-chain amino acid ABC transporter permease [Agaricicola taiwanensis]GGE28361.1 hypothetical protein GCM10007276_01950 [Agaricicola taiwanensis]
MPLLLLLAGLAVMAVLPLAVPWLQFTLTIALAKGLAALGVAVLLRAGLISIGHAMFFAIGAYATAFLMRDLAVTDFATLIVASTLISALSGLLFGAFLVRYRAIFFAMLNLAVSMVLFSLLAKLYGVTGGTDGIRVATPSVFGMALARPVFADVLYYGGLLLAGLVGFAVHRYLKSPLGAALSAIHTNEVRLEYLGVSAWSVLLVAYTLSATLAGLGGAIAAMAIGHVVPEFAFWTESGHIVLVAVLGGIGGVVGPFAGSIFLEVVQTLAVGFAADAWNLIIGLALIGVIFFLPRGLYGLMETRRRTSP